VTSTGFVERGGSLIKIPCHVGKGVLLNEHCEVRANNLKEYSDEQKKSMEMGRSRCRHMGTGRVYRAGSRAYSDDFYSPQQ
jgi:hypothetical protein